MKPAAQHSVHPTSGSLRVLKSFLWLEAGSVKMALSRPTHQQVTQAVRCRSSNWVKCKYHVAYSSSLERTPHKERGMCFVKVMSFFGSFAIAAL
jgi:hypothetical protein